MKDELILVDGNDCEIGFMDKLSCHVEDGILHRAFSVFIFNSRGELLIQRRAREKMLWGGFWSNSCCSHPRKGEDIEDAASRRIVEELGIACSLRYIYKFKYFAKFDEAGSEKELCSVFMGTCDDEPTINLDEASEFKWIKINDLLDDVSLFPGKYTPWFLKEVQELRSRGNI